VNTVAPKSAVFILVMELPGTGGPPWVLVPWLAALLMMAGGALLRRS
jgi:MprA protease rhombosortase-interaction domain-containing protein